MEAEVKLSLFWWWRTHSEGVPFAMNFDGGRDLGDTLESLWPSQSVVGDQGWLGWLATTSSRLEMEAVEGRERIGHRPAVCLSPPDRRLNPFYFLHQ